MQSINQLELSQLAISLIQLNPLAVMICDADGIIFRVNPAFEALLGFESGELCGKPVSCLIPDQYHHHDQFIKAYFNAPDKYASAMQSRPELAARHKDGSEIYVRINLIHHVSETLNYVIAILGDNRQVVQFRKKLVKAEQFFKELFLRAPVPMALNDNDGNITALNDQFIKTFGYDLEDIPTLSSWWPCAYPDAEYRASVANAWQQNLQAAKSDNNAVNSLTVSIRCKDNSVRTVIASASTLDDDANSEHLVTLVDITEQEQAQQSLFDSEQRLRTMIESHQLPMLLIEPSSGNIILANQGACDFYEYAPTEMVALRIHDLYRESDTVIDGLIESVLNKKRSAFEKTHYTRNNKALKVHVYSSPVEISGNSFLYSIIVDKTEEHTVLSELINKENDYKNLYQSSAVGILLEDFSGLYRQLDDLRSQGVVDLDAYIQSNPNLLIKLSETIVIKDVNPALAQLLGYENNERDLVNVHQTFGPNAIDVFKNELLAIWRKDEKFESLVMLCTAEGEWIKAAISLPIPTAINRAALVPVSIVNLNPLDKAQQEITFHSNVLTTLNEGVHIVRPETGNIVYSNQRLTDMFGYLDGELLDKHFSILNSARGKWVDEADIAVELTKRGYWHGEVESRQKDGTIFWCDTTVSTVDHPEYGLVWVSVFSDITERRDYTHKLWRQGNFDSLTELPNREYFYDRARQIISGSNRKNFECALLFIDLDEFKRVNDTLGHAHGDALLIEVSSRLEQCIRESDVIGRFGGDEFVVLMQDIKVDKPSTIEKLAEKITQAVSAPLLINGEADNISASIGISTYPRDAEDVETLIQYADQAMYQAKALGKNQYHFFTASLQDLALRNRMLEQALRQAIARNELEVYLQPIVHCQTGAILKAEALLRWFHPELGCISPVEFIPLAEESSLICEIGNFVFKECIDILQVLKTNTELDFQISLNKSPVQLTNQEYQTEITWREQMQACGLDPNAICIEITEGIFLAESSDTEAKIDAFKRAGFNFSIDDFGTGFSALSSLQKIQFNYLKIDKSFIDSLEVTFGNQALCEAIIMMAHKLDMEVIAEGIEREEQYELLKSMGCDYCQGYYFAKPMPRQAFFDLVGKH